ncbi:secreted RxLR effector protein 161-like [Bidens hawaiensis]|uniref:secreted RxLR effector protein 161-like n=1 Tax=Bidens hawaiensis TaxID=980011 RepID=UPI004049336E
MNFHRCMKEQAVYRKISGSCLNMINGFKKNMASKFDMSDLGKLSYYLGIEVSQCKDGIKIKQESYARKNLKEAGMENCNPAYVPMDPNLKLSNAKDEIDVEATGYRKIVGCLRYLLQTRPDLTYSIGIVSRYMQQPKESHENAIKHILRYVKTTPSYGIKYNRGERTMLIGFSDSSHNIDEDDGRSTTGHIFYYGSSPISWCSQKQGT